MSSRKRFLAVKFIRMAHAEMTNSLVARNVDISSVMTRYLTKNGAKRAKNYPKTRLTTVTC